MDPLRPVTADELEVLVRGLLDAGLEAVAAEGCVDRGLHDPEARCWFDERGCRNALDLIAVGKAADSMCAELLRRAPELGAVVARALVVCPDEEPRPASRPSCVASDVPIERLTAEHPLPGPQGLHAARRVEEWVAGGAGRDLIFLLSGGASSMLPAPADGFSLEDKVYISDHLLRAGADIHELNAVRSQMSRTKGGRLAARSRYARCLVLVISDVVGDDLAVVGSGPWFPSAASGQRAAEIVRSLAGAAAESLARRLEATPDPPSPDHEGFERVCHMICGSGAEANAAMQSRADSLVENADEAGWQCHSWGSEVTGEARRVARALVRSVRERATRDALPLFGGGIWTGAGETTVTVRGEGFGGRNQELALAFALEWERGGLRSEDGGVRRFAFAALGTDGKDGPTPAAGALVDQTTLDRMRAVGVDPQGALERNDSHSALEAVRATVVTGPTGTNVGDAMVCVVPPAR